MNEWDARFEYYARSPTHAEGDDLEQVVAWCAPGSGVTALTRSLAAHRSICPLALLAGLGRLEPLRYRFSRTPST